MSDKPTSSKSHPDHEGSVRRKPRYSANLKVEMFTKGLDHHLVEKTANISEGGLFLCSDYAAEMNEKMHLRVILSDRDAYFDVKAVVVWTCDGTGSHPKGIGLRFIELNDAQTGVIEKILKNYVNIQDS